MSLDIKFLIIIFLTASMGAQASLENLVRNAALENGLMSAEELNPSLDAELVKIGKIFLIPQVRV